MKHKITLLACSMLLLGGTSAFAKSSIFVLITDLYDQKSIKPQEVGSMSKFPVGTVTTDGKVFESTEQNLDWMGTQMSVDTATPNPVPATPESLVNGELKFNTYCAVCHTSSSETNEMGTAKSKVNERGMVAPAMLALTPSFPDGYIYSKAKYGGIVMPPLGYATTEKDRWDIVNYIRNKLEKQQ